MERVAELAVEFRCSELRVDGFDLVVLRGGALHYRIDDAAVPQKRLEIQLQAFTRARGGKDAGDPDLLAAVGLGDAERPACFTRVARGRRA